MLANRSHHAPAIYRLGRRSSAQRRIHLTLGVRVLAATLAAALALSAQTLGDAHEAPRSYVVEGGDTLWSIAQVTGIPVERLVTLNGITNPDYVTVGQTLSLAVGADAASAASYVVQPGDTLSGIAASRGLTADLLAQWNGLADPNVIREGTVLKLAGELRPRTVNRAALANANWLGSPNYWEGRSQAPIALVLHTAGGSLSGIEHEFANPLSRVSAHFGVGLDGSIHQYVNLKDRAWANGILETGHVWPGPAWTNPNDLTVSIEAEDLGNPSQRVTEAQYQSTLAIGRVVLSQYPTIKYLITHRAISPETREWDPGPRWVASGKFHALAKELGLIAIE